MYGNVFLIPIFLHQDSRTWCVLLFFLFIYLFCKFFVCLHDQVVAMHSCSFVFKIVEGFVCLFVCFCLFASSFKNTIMFQLFASSTPSFSTPFQSIHERNFALKIVK